MNVVIKVGTNLLTNKKGTIDKNRVKKLSREIIQVRKKGHNVVLVSSGAIGAGMGKMKLTKRPHALPQKQALAAIGQPLLMDIYQESFDWFGVNIAQVLLTRHDFIDRQKYLNARNTMLSLAKMGVVAIVNENDTVAVEEIKFGENDTLSALVAAKINADMLIMLTDVDGFYKGKPGKSELLSTVEQITPELYAHATCESGSGKGIGGMKTKLDAARITTSSGVVCVIANGNKDDVIKKIVDGEEIGTRFIPGKAKGARKTWIAFGTTCSGKIVVDDGAVKALIEKNKSLLPSGITSVEGIFKQGDTVSILDKDGSEVARGMVSYSSDDINKIKGKKSEEAKQILNSSSFAEVIHRDNLVIL